MTIHRPSAEAGKRAGHALCERIQHRFGVASAAEFTRALVAASVFRLSEIMGRVETAAFLGRMLEELAVREAREAVRRRMN